MDPDACVARIQSALDDGRYLDAKIFIDDLRDWLGRGGFPPAKKPVAPPGTPTSVVRAVGLLVKRIATARGK